IFFMIINQIDKSDKVELMPPKLKQTIINCTLYWPFKKLFLSLTMIARHRFRNRDRSVGKARLPLRRSLLNMECAENMVMGLG
ncbi:MAG TPA: hypothetical protein PLD30_17245, partial [Candidatus Competibacteraceae bacterium]|nr:hypothetical protein [Candidatus Competibacteraceae bacterium]